MSELTFYTNPLSRGQIVRWMLEEVGAPYETEVLDYATTMKAEPYLSINPMGKVPAIRHKGRVVTECAGICAYLADVFPEAGLAPRDEEKADYYRWLFFAAGPVEQAVTNHAAGFDPTEDRRRMFGYGSYEQTVATLDRHFADHDYVCGERFTAADVYAGSQVMWGMQFGTLPRRDSFERYAARLMPREALQRAKAIDQELIEQMQAAEGAPA